MGFFLWSGLVPMSHLFLRKEINTVSQTIDLLVWPVFYVRWLKGFFHHKLYSLLESHHVSSNSQFRFHGRRSTVSLLLSAVNVWAETLDHLLSTHYVFIDFAKAFNSVTHECLLIKLETIGFRGTLLQWFRAFLTSRC